MDRTDRMCGNLSPVEGRDRPQRSPWLPAPCGRGHCMQTALDRTSFSAQETGTPAPSDANKQAIKSPLPTNPGVTTKQGSRSYFSPVGHAGNSSHFTHLKSPFTKTQCATQACILMCLLSVCRETRMFSPPPTRKSPRPTRRRTCVRICSAVQRKPAGGHSCRCPAVVPCPAPLPPQGEPSLRWFQFRLEKKTTR